MQMCFWTMLIVSSSLKEPGKFVGTKAFSLLPLGHFEQKWFFQNVK